MSSCSPSSLPNPETHGAMPVALTVAGSDSGGGAGIQADLAAFSFFRTFGTTAITAVTAQNPHSVTAVAALPSADIAAQISAVFSAFSVKAVKTGMLFSTGIIRTVAETLGDRPDVPLVVDPVMVATSGSKLLEDEAVKTLCSTLLPQADVITPNRYEAEILVERTLSPGDSGADVAAELARRFRAHVLVKGGHADGTDAVDVLSDGNRTWSLSSPRLSVPTTHGTGCSLSAAIAACLALGHDPLEAVRRAKAYVLARLQNCRKVGVDTWAMCPPPELPMDTVLCREM